MFVGFMWMNGGLGVQGMGLSSYTAAMGIKVVVESRETHGWVTCPHGCRKNWHWDEA
jgi:hypothetical protein